METPTRPLSRREAAAYLLARHGIKRSPQTLAKQAVTGGGPPFRRAGHAVLYDPAALDRYVEEISTAAVRSTSELPSRFRRPACNQDRGQ
jgi:hypothetical protein